MRKRGLILALLLGGILAKFTFGDGGTFEMYSDEKILDLHTVYFYEYSTDKDGYAPNKYFAYYIKEFNLIDQIYINSKANKQTSHLFTYVFDYKNMMLSNMIYKRLGDFSSLKEGNDLSGETKVNFTKKTIEINRILKAPLNEKNVKNFKFHLKKIPSYFYQSTKGLDLWHILRFFSFSKKKEIDLSDCQLNRNGYNVDIIVKYKGIEKVTVPFGEIHCHKFEVTPKGFLARMMGKKAYVWLNAEEGNMYMVKYINNNVVNTFEPKIEMRLVDRKKVAPEEWDRAVESGEIKF